MDKATWTVTKRGQKKWRELNRASFEMFDELSNNLFDKTPNGIFVLVLATLFENYRLQTYQHLLSRAI